MSNGGVRVHLCAKYAFQTQESRMADTEEPQNEEEFVKRQSNKKFFYRGIEVQDLVGMKKPQFMDLLHARARRKFVRGLKPGAFHLIKRLRKAKKLAGPNEKPSAVKTRLRNVIIMPEMVGSVVGVYNGKTYITVEIKVGSATSKSP